MNSYLRLMLLCGCLGLWGCDEKIFQPDLTPPSVPQGLLSQTGDNEISISWISSPEPDVAGYNVYVSSSDRTGFSFLGSTRVPQFVDKGIENGKTYYYAVSAYDFAGNESELSGEIAYDTPRPEGYDVILENYRTHPDLSGYDFSTNSVGLYNDKYTDVFFEYYDGTMYLDVWDDSEIQDVGYTKSLYDIGEAPSDGWSPSKDVRLISGHTYVVRTWDYHFAKVRITSLSSGVVVFDWAYQLQQDNPRLKISSPVGRKPLALGPGAKGR